MVVSVEKIFCSGGVGYSFRYEELCKKIGYFQIFRKQTHRIRIRRSDIPYNFFTFIYIHKCLRHYLPFSLIILLIVFFEYFEEMKLATKEKITKKTKNDKQPSTAGSLFFKKAVEIK